MIVPCYNESMRISLDYWDQIIEATDTIDWIFVNDGSSDDTPKLLSQISGGLRTTVLNLPHNKGKAEALRIGFLEATAREYEIIGLIDADGSFEKQEVIALCQKFQNKHEWNSSQQSYDAIFMSRNSLLNGVESVSLLRKFSGFVVSSFNSAVWRELPKDTQCGFKFFNFSNMSKSTILKPFSNSWFFEIEFLIRLREIKHLPLFIKEVPLNFCKHIEGSKTDKSNTLNSVQQIFSTFFKLVSFRLRNFGSKKNF